jgi:hypothetical protein
VHSCRYDRWRRYEGKKEIIYQGKGLKWGGGGSARDLKQVPLFIHGIFDFYRHEDTQTEGHHQIKTNSCTLRPRLLDYHYLLEKTHAHTTSCSFQILERPKNNTTPLTHTHDAQNLRPCSHKKTHDTTRKIFTKWSPGPY